MFLNAYQSGSALEIFDPKSIVLLIFVFFGSDIDNNANKETKKLYQKLVKVNFNQNSKKVFDRDMKGFYRLNNCFKGYILELNGNSTKIQFPRSGELGLVQQYLVLQIYLFSGQQWSLELLLTCTCKVFLIVKKKIQTKRRILLTTSVKFLEQKYFHIKSPIDQIRRDMWLNLQVDLWSFSEAWKGVTFKCLDMVTISSPCRLRKIFITSNPIADSELSDTDIKFVNSFQQIPRNVQFPEGFRYNNQVITFRLLNFNYFIEHNSFTLKDSPAYNEMLNNIKKNKLISNSREVNQRQISPPKQKSQQLKKIYNSESRPQIQVSRYQNINYDEFNDNQNLMYESEENFDNTGQNYIELNKKIYRIENDNQIDHQEQLEEIEEDVQFNENEFQSDSQQELIKLFSQNVIQERINPEEDNEEFINVVYDPVLNLYYDCKTDSYYQMNKEF